MTDAGDFLPDLDAVSDADWEKAKMIFVNYPQQPHLGLRPPGLLREAGEAKCPRQRTP